MATIAANPYALQLGDRDPLVVLSETPTALRHLTSGWSEQEFGRTLGPGKWTARQILLHLLQAELVFGLRVRMAVNGDAREVQPFDQDPWVSRESANGTAREFLSSLLALRQINLALFRSLTPAEKSIELHHPQQGTINVEWILRALAGHDRNHIAQLEALADSAASE